MFVQTLQDFERRIHVNTSLFSREPQLYKGCVRPSVCPLVGPSVGPSIGPLVQNLFFSAGRDEPANDL